MMKNISVWAFLLTLHVSYGVLAQNLVLSTKDNLVFKSENGVEQVYDKNDKLFSGAVVLPDEDGRDLTYIYRDGLRHGIAVSHYEDGKMELEITYEKGLKNGEEIAFYANGNPKYKRTYKKNVLHGDEIFFYENGKPQQHNQYVDGQLHGIVTYFDNNGNRTRIENYKNGRKNGPEHIIENNILKEEHYYVDGMLNGISKKFDEKYLREETEYKDGQKDGLSKQYLLDGSIIEIPYVRGQKNGTAFAYYPDKKIANKADYINDKKNGLSEKYYKNGHLQIRENYINDKQEGISRYFNDKGELLKVSYYVDGVELAVADVAKNTELNDIYMAYRSGQLGKYLNKKNLWYPILWLGLNLDSPDILDTLSQEMKMYVSEIDDTNVYVRESKSKYAAYNRNLYFGLTPLSYAVNLSSPVEILQKFATDSERVEEVNPRGTTALLEAIHLNNPEMVKYLLLHQADVKKKYTGGNTALLYAVKEKIELPVIRELLTAGVDTNALDAEDKNALMLAIEDNNVELVDLLAEYGADMNAMAPDGKTMLFYAFSQQADDKIIDRMFQSGADVNKKDKFGNVLLIQALTEENYAIVEKLLVAGADVNLPDDQQINAVSYVLYNKVNDGIATKIFDRNIDVKSLHPKYQKQLWQLAMEQNRPDLLKIVFDKMESIISSENNQPVPFAQVLENHENTALVDLALQYVSAADLDNHPEFISQAVALKDIELWRKLIAKGADMNKVKIAEEPLLLYLIKNNYDIDFIQAMETENLDVNITNANGEDALWLAIRSGNEKLADNLIRHGAEVNKLKDGRPYLMEIKTNQEALTNLLLNNKADMTLQAADKTTMLMAAVENLNTTLITHLFEAGVDTYARDEDGNNALLYLAEAVQTHLELPEEVLVEKIYETAKLMQEHEIDINSRNGNGESLLIRLARTNRNSYARLAEKLQELGVNPSLKDQYGKTAADYLKDSLADKNKIDKK